MSKYHLIVDVALCENCCNCFLAVKDEYCDNEFPGYSKSQPRHGHRWFDIKEKERGSGSLIDVAYLPVTCNQCADAPCVKAATDGAIAQRSDGIVMIDTVRAKGQKDLVKSCPYGHIWWNEEEQLPQKWSFDAHLMDNGWKEPRPVQSCGTRSLTFVKCDDEEMANRAKQQGLEVLHPEFGTKPRVWYKNLHRFNAAFIAGSISIVENDLRECATDATVSLSYDGECKEICQTDAFGDFKFDGLPVNSGEYVLTVQYEDRPSTSKSVVLEESINVGEICLDLVS